MTEAAQAFTALAAILAGASIHPRLRRLIKAAWACVAIVGLCLAVDILL